MGKPPGIPAPDTQLFRDIFNASPIGIAVETLDGQPLFVNPALCAMLGFSEEEMRGKHCVDFSPPEDANKDWALFQQLRAESIDHYRLEKRYFRRDGSLLWGSLCVSLLNSRPSPLVIAMVQDITDKKAAEEAQLRNAALVKSSEDAIISKTLDGVILNWNEGAQRVFGYTEAEAIGKSVGMLVPPDLLEEEALILAKLRAGERIEHYETVRINKAGKRIALSLSVSPIKDSSGAILGLCGIARDISDRKSYEEKLLEYERAVENSGEMICVVDRDYRYLIANRQFLKMRNMTSEQVVGHPAYEVLNPGVFETVVKPRLDESFQGKVVRYECKYAYPEVGERDVSVSYFPIEGINGIDRVASIVQDITERKRAEEALAGISRKLLEAQEKERARIGRELHDDINQRLAMLNVELEQLEEHPSEFQSRVQKLRERVTELSGDIQALSHDLHSSKLEYLGVVASMKSWCREFAERQRMEIDFKSSVSSAVALEVGLSLFRVLQEALSNANKHSGLRRVEVELREDSNDIHLVICDAGKGFDVEMALQGKGLGLTSMQERVRLVNGTVAIQSKPMGGTRIHVRVPFRSKQNSRRAAGS
jgi:PAS domain S-box-containing protein